jgi:hypothetical protein
VRGITLSVSCQFLNNNNNNNRINTTIG